jgi:hypothetical protein
MVEGKMELWEQNVAQLRKDLDQTGEWRAVEVDFTRFPCLDCLKNPISQIYICNRVNRPRRVCDLCFKVAYREGRIVKEVGEFDVVLSTPES